MSKTIIISQIFKQYPSPHRIPERPFLPYLQFRFRHFYTIPASMPISLTAAAATQAITHCQTTV